jgi:hypothetical protein
VTVSIYALTRAAGQPGAARPVWPATAATVHELLLVTGLAGLAALSAGVISWEIHPVQLLLLAAGVAVAGWGMRVLTTQRAPMVPWIVLGLVALPAIANWTVGATGELTALSLATATALALSVPLRAAAPWIPWGERPAAWTPPVGSGDVSRVIGTALSDLRVWARTAWAGMLGATTAFWVAIGCTVAGALALVAAPLALLNQAGAYLSGDGGTSRIAGLVWLILGLELVAGTVGAVLGLACSQALTGAVAGYADTSHGRLDGRALAGGGLTTLRAQLSTVGLYTIGVLVGGMLFLIPGLLVQVRWAFALPVGAATGVRGTNALNTSWRLTEKRFWRTFYAQVMGGTFIALSLPVAAGCAWVAMFVFGSSLVAAAAACVPVCLAMMGAAVIMGSLYRQYVSAIG